jgi:glycerol uptake facilitator-like aquaporin
LSVGRRAGAEFLGTAFLLAAVVGSGIMGERLSGGNVAITLLANSLATGFALAALIIVFGPMSGAHFNPVVTLSLALRRQADWRDAAPYLVAQFAGAMAGVWAAHMMFELPGVQASATVRSGGAQIFSEVLATFGLVTVVLNCGRDRPWAAPIAVGGYIAAAYWFTASTSFANPAVTMARAMTATFSGIRLEDVAGFVAAQAAGALLAVAADRLLKDSPRGSPDRNAEPGALSISTRRSDIPPERMTHSRPDL